jgi:hypothetical protein
MRQDGHWRDASNRAKPVQMPKIRVCDRCVD